MVAKKPSRLRSILMHSCCAGALGVAFHTLAQTAPTLPAPDAFPVTIRIDAAKPIGPLKPIWRFFGADEPNYATMKDGRKLLSELGELAPQSVYFRAHNLLCTGDGTPALKWGSSGVYSEDAEGHPVYDWRVLDMIFDTYLERGVRPYAQIGFMPKALSTRPEPYQHEWRPGMAYDRISTGWAWPPKDYSKWEELCFQWVKHCIDRYGRAEVEQWYWQVWNEPNGAAYWHGTPEEFYKLHDYAIAGVRRALPSARVGGPDVAGHGGGFMEGFMRHVVHGTNYATGQRGTPTDFLSFHAKGGPSVVDGRVRMGIANHLSTIDRGFSMIAAVPELKSTPIVIGESDPDGCAACTAAVYPQNDYRNSELYASYTAACFGREQAMADRHGVNLEGVLTWAFEFEDQPYFAGFRVLASNGIDLPVLNVFRMLSMMSGERLTVESTAEVPLETILRKGVRGSNPDITALAARDANKATVLVWHYHDDSAAGPDASVEMRLDGLSTDVENASVAHYRIDRDHSNAYRLWQKMGSPAGPNVKEYEQLVAAGRLARLGEAPSTVPINGGQTALRFTLPRQSVSLLVLEWK